MLVSSAYCRIPANAFSQSWKWPFPFPDLEINGILVSPPQGPLRELRLNAEFRDSRLMPGAVQGGEDC